MKEKSALNPKTETNQEITVVPMFAPKVRGNICSSEIALTAHNGTKVEVVILLD